MTGQKHLLIMALMASAVILLQGSNASPSPGSEKCKEEGNFPMQDHCDAYYKCSPWRDTFQQDFLECPSGKVFDEEMDTCLEPYLVTSRPECKPEEAVFGGTTTSDVEAQLRDPLEQVLSNCPSGKVLDNETDTCLEPYVTTSRPEFMAEEDVFGETTTGVSNNTGTSEIEAGESVNDIHQTRDTLKQVLSLGGTTTVVSDNTGTSDVEAGERINDIHQMIQNVTMISNQICHHVTVIGNYVTLMTSSIPLHVKNLPQSEYKNFLLDYNNALERSRNIVRTWRSGINILANVREIFHLAKNYELKFDETYEIYERRQISSSPSSSLVSARIKGLHEDIEILIQDIKYNEEASEDAPQSMKLFLLKKVARSKMELKKKMQRLQEVSNSDSGFTSAAIFLEIVSSDTQNIENKTKDLRNRIDAWYSDLADAQRTLRSHYMHLNNYVEQFKTDIKQSREDITLNQNDIRDSRAQKETFESYISGLDDNIKNNLQKVKDAMDAIERKEDEHERKIEEACDPNGPNKSKIAEMLLIHKIMEMVCQLIRRSLVPPLNIKADKEQLQQLRNVVEHNNTRMMNEIQTTNAKFSDIQEDIRQREKNIQELRSKIRERQAEVRNIQLVISQQRNIKQIWNPATEAIQAMIQDLDKVHNTFRLIHMNLDKMVSKVTRTQKNKSDLQEVKKAIKQLQDQIDQSSAKIQDVGNCS